MGSLHDGDQSSAAKANMMIDGYGGYDVDAADATKQMVMAMTAVAMVLATVIGVLVLSGAVHTLSGVLCASVDLPTLVRMS